MPYECSEELKVDRKETHNLVVAQLKPSIGDLIQVDRFSSFRKLVRVTAYVIRAVRKFKSKTANLHIGPLSVDELTIAERYWIKDSQKNLEQEKSFNSLKAQLNLFLDGDGMWRCGGRLANVDVPYSTKYPLLLSRDHPLTPPCGR